MKNSTYVVRKPFWLSVAFFLLVVPLQAQQIAKSLTAANGELIGFYEYKPVDYNTNTKYPVIIFLHGIGERGNGTTDLSRVLGNGTPNNIQNGHNMRFYWNGKWETFLVLTPQLNGKYGNWQNFYVEEMLKHARNNLSIDTNRIFLTGLSLGGGGVWSYAGASLANAKKFAAIGVTCGTCQNLNWCNFANANLPVWAWHAADDGTVGAGCSTGAIQAINNCNPAVKPYLTIWPTGQHWIWGRVYSTNYDAQHPNIYEWFLGQDKSKPVNKRPVANAGANKAITTGLGVVTLDATGSSDQDGKIVRYVWTQTGGPIMTQLPNAGILTTPLATITGFSLPGNYTFELRVLDDRADWATANVTIAVSSGPAPTNQPPVAKAGNDITLTLPVNSTKLDGSGSSDPDGSIASYSWSYVSGPIQYTIANPGSVSTDLTNLAEGDYVFRLIVTDNGGLTNEDQVTVHVLRAGSIPPPNQPPVASAGTDIVLTLPANSTTLDGNSSLDPDNNIDSYAWTMVNGPAQYNIAAPGSARTGVSNLAEGTYAFRLLVTDSEGLTDSDTITVKVQQSSQPGGQPGVSDAGESFTIKAPANSVVLDGTGSYDPDGSLNKYEWSLFSGPSQYTILNKNTVTTTVTNLVQGTYIFRLVVWDSDWMPVDDTVWVTVNPADPTPNRPPVANAGTDITIKLPTDYTTLNGSASGDPDNNISSYLWTRVSGPTGYSIANSGSASTNLLDLEEGTYLFRLLVTDAEGVSDADTVQVTVQPADPTPNQKPVANAGANITIKLPINSTTLNGSASSDPDGTIDSYQWFKLTGPAAYDIDNPGSASTPLNGLAQGTYTFRLLVTDNGGLTDDDTVQVTVQAADPPPNQKPAANAGTNITIKLPVNNTTLNGSASSDPDGSINSYQWSKVTGPAAYDIVNPGSASTPLNGLAQGTYTFRLLVTDNGGLTDDDTVQVTVQAADAPPNQQPVARAGNDITIKLPVNNTTLNGSASSDPDGTIDSYQWSKLTGPAAYDIVNPGSASTPLNGLSQGTYTFRLVVTDNGGLTDDDTVRVTVLAADPPANQKPVAKAGNDISITLPTDSTMLNGAASSDPDGNINNYQWTKLSGPASYSLANASAASTRLRNLTEGIYTFRLVVTDNGGLTDADTVKVTVNPEPNALPVADAGNDFGVNLPNPDITLNGTASYDPDGTIESYRWARVTGPGAVTLVNSTTATPVVVGAITGKHVFELTVTDNKGSKAKDQVTVTVSAGNGSRPVANAGQDTGIAVPATSAVLDGRASYDPDGVIVSYLWRQIEGPTVSILANLYGSVTVVNELEPGEYQFELTVTDNSGVTDSDTIRVMVFNNYHYEESLLVFPNPAYSATLNIRFVSDSVGTARITIFDMNGRVVQATKAEKQQSYFEYPLNIAGLKKGVYFLEIVIGGKKRVITKFVKR